MELDLINLELKFATKKVNPQINLPFNYLIQKYLFHNNPIYYSEYVFLVGTRGAYSWYKVLGQKLSEKTGIGIGIEKKIELELNWNIWGGIGIEMEWSRIGINKMELATYLIYIYIYIYILLKNKYIV